MKSPSKHERLRGWLQLLRLPHLFSVPGDPLAAFLIAGGLAHRTGGFFPLAAVCFVSFAMSLFGIITNDLADIQLDMEQHPDRPLPRGVVSPREASYASQLCFLAAVVTAGCLGWRFFLITLVVLVSIYTYNFYVKYRPRRASMMMAVMRDLSFALGILIVPGISLTRILLLILYGVGVFLFYCGLNEITRSEMMSKMVRPGGRRVLSGACCCAIVPLAFTVKLFRDSATLPPILYGLFGIVLCLLFLLAALWVYQVSRTGSSPARIRMAVLVSFRAAMMAQAAVAASCGLIVLPLVLLAGLVCSALSEKYSVS